jgi:hypothetical protein
VFRLQVVCGTEMHIVVNKVKVVLLGIAGVISAQKGATKSGLQDAMNLKGG